MDLVNRSECDLPPVQLTVMALEVSLIFVAVLGVWLVYNAKYLSLLIYQQW